MAIRINIFTPTMPLSVTEIRRQAFLNDNATSPKTDTSVPRLVQNSAFKRRRMVIKGDVKPGMKRLIRFLELLTDFDAAPWANKIFDVNQMMIRRLTHSHLPLIAGESVPFAEPPRASRLIAR